MIEYRFSYWGPLLVDMQIEQEFVDILLEKGRESRKKNLDATKRLAGVIEHEYFYDNVGDWYFTKMDPYVAAYLNAVTQYYAEIGNMLISNTPVPSTVTRWELKQLWINFQHAKEYNPPHDHAGDISFVIYLQVPDEIKEENERTKEDRAYEGPGMITFDYGQRMPFSISRQYRMPSQGGLIIFPSWLQHHVHSFESDVERISVSGNIDFKYD